MIDERIVIPFPSDTIRLNGILQDTLSAIRCATSNLTYKQHMHISSVLLFACSDVLMTALKSLSIKHEIGFNTECAALYVSKHLCNTSDEMVLTALLLTSIEKAFSIYSEFGMSDEVELSAEKAFAKLSECYEISDNIAFAAEKLLEPLAHFNFDASSFPMSASKNAERVNIVHLLEGSLSFIVEKYNGKTLSDSGFSSCVKLSVACFRKMSDLAGLTFADISSWNMDTFHIIRK